MSTTTLPKTGRSLAGNLTRDPELRYSAKGKPWCSFGLAVNAQSFDDDTGEWVEEEPTFFDVVCFGTIAENVAESFRKGARVIAQGRVEETTWTAKDGTERHGWRFVAEDVGASVLRTTVVIERAKREEPKPAPLRHGEPFPACPEGEEW